MQALAEVERYSFDGRELLIHTKSFDAPLRFRGISPGGVDATPTPKPAGPWNDIAPLAAGARQETAVVAFGDEILVLGGFDGRGAVSALAEAYSPTTKTWRRLPDLPAAMHHANAAVVGDALYVVGFLAGSTSRRMDESSSCGMARPPGRLSAACPPDRAGLVRRWRHRRQDLSRRRLAKRLRRRLLALRPGHGLVGVARRRPRTPRPRRRGGGRREVHPRRWTGRRYHVITGRGYLRPDAAKWGPRSADAHAAGRYGRQPYSMGGCMSSAAKATRRIPRACSLSPRRTTSRRTPGPRSLRWNATPRDERGHPGRLHLCPRRGNAPGLRSGGDGRQVHAVAAASLKAAVERHAEAPAAHVADGGRFHPVHHVRPAHLRVHIGDAEGAARATVAEDSRVRADRHRSLRTMKPRPTHGAAIVRSGR